MWTIQKIQYGEFPITSCQDLLVNTSLLPMLIGMTAFHFIWWYKKTQSLQNWVMPLFLLKYLSIYHVILFLVNCPKTYNYLHQDWPSWKMEIVHYFKINTRSGRLVFINTWNMTTIWKPSWVFFWYAYAKTAKIGQCLPERNTCWDNWQMDKWVRIVNLHQFCDKKVGKSHCILRYQLSKVWCY